MVLCLVPNQAKTMKIYYVNTNPQPNGDHEVHAQDCTFIPNFINRKYLGDFVSCDGAVKKAKESHPQSNGCKTCCNSCHTS